MARTSNVAGTQTTLTMRFRVPADLPTTTRIFLQLPPYAFYKSATSKCHNENGKVLACSFQENNDPLDTRRINSYVSQVEVTDLCGVQVLCSANAFASVLVEIDNQLSVADYLTNSQFTYLVLNSDSNQLYQQTTTSTLGATTTGAFLSSSFVSSDLKIKAT